MTVAADKELDDRRANRDDNAVPRKFFRPDIEGLRAVAVVAVVLFHAGLPGMHGGFIGVDVFFVVSGFLVTEILYRRTVATGTIEAARFYGARARRLLPAAGVVLVATAIAAAVLLPPLPARRVLGDGIAAALYAGNYRFALHDIDYLAGDTLPSPFRHFWSLGVEEQFYLLWPAVIAATTWVIRRRAAAVTPLPYLIALALVAGSSFALSLSWTETLPSWAFFSLPTRAWELAAGGMIALSTTVWSRLPRIPATLVGWIGLLLIIAACVRFDEHTRYPGTAALLPVAGTVLVIVSGCSAPRFGVGRGLALTPVRAIGRGSYSWYLWHWPVLLLAPRALGHPLGPSGSLGAIMVAGGLAMLTLWLVENPVRFAERLHVSAARSLACGGAATAIAGGTALALLVLVPAPIGRGAPAPALALAAPAAPTTPVVDPIEETIRRQTEQAQTAIAAATDLRAVPTNLAPALAEAAGSKAEVFGNGCVRSWHEVGQAECAFGAPDSATTVALVGDSHAAMWHPAFERVAAARHWRLETMAKVTCPLMDLPITSPYLGRRYTECERWRDQVMTRLRIERPRLIVLSMSRRYGADFGFVSYDPAWIDGLRRLVARLRSTGATVLVLGPVPDPHTDVPLCLSEHLDDPTACAPTRADALDDAGIAAERAATIAGGGRYADLTPLFCAPTGCPLVIGDNLVFRDDNHLTVEYAETLAPVIDTLTERAPTRN
ncbi:acyltransferase family protein [Nocardia paucivorans]|uniref:acyltransferase family protein n=1 Tax=Nocardia paucivorans TaxID=114259 RepID=UPI000594F951|nr:acyltransferase family protein [Nocardia paucivorans]